MRTLVLLGALVSIARSAHAQIVSGPKPSAAECRAAADGLRRTPHDTETWANLFACPEQAKSAVVTAVSRTRLEADTSYLQYLLSVATGVRTPQLLAAALQLNRDKGATRAARVTSLEILLAHIAPYMWLRPMGMSWSTHLSVPRGEACRIMYLTDSEYIATAPMPSNYLEQIAARTDSMANDTTESRVLRDLASCVRATITIEVPSRRVPAFPHAMHR
jgi:hypothetical protein